jgi:hypothetical protein
VVAGSADETLAEMRENPAGVRFADACKVATHYFGQPRQNGTSHKVWKMPWPGDPRINMQAGDGGKAKAYQVRQAVAAIDTLLARAASPATATQPPLEPKSSKPKKRNQKRKR